MPERLGRRNCDGDAQRGEEDGGEKIVERLRLAVHDAAERETGEGHTRQKGRDEEGDVESRRHPHEAEQHPEHRQQLGLGVEVPPQKEGHHAFHHHAHAHEERRGAAHASQDGGRPPRKLREHRQQQDHEAVLQKQHPHHGTPERLEQLPAPLQQTHPDDRGAGCQGEAEVEGLGHRVVEADGEAYTRPGQHDELHEPDAEGRGRVRADALEAQIRSHHEEQDRHAQKQNALDEGRVAHEARGVQCEAPDQQEGNRGQVGPPGEPEADGGQAQQDGKFNHGANTSLDSSSWSSCRAPSCFERIK